MRACRETAWVPIILILGLGITACDRRPVAAPPSKPGPAAVVPGPRLSDVTAACGIDFKHRSGAGGAFRLPEIMSGGGGFLDVDGDQLLDIYLVQSATGPQGGASSSGPAGNRLYRNRGDGTFEDITGPSGTGDSGYGMGCAAGDIDNDGDVDLYVTNFGENVLYLNDGHGTFQNVTASAGVGAAGWSSSATFLDFDRDGWLDLFVAHYVDWQDTPAFMSRLCYGKNGARDYCSPRAYDAPAVDHLFHNNGDGTFRDVSRSSGIAAKRGTGLGVISADLNDDAWPDIYVSNDQMASFAWINRRDGTFVDSAVPLGCALDDMGRPQAGMGVDAADVDGDSDLDLWKVHLHRESHILYINRGTYFDDRTTAWGLAAPTMPYTGFGTALLDIDLDGLLDIFVANGRVQYVVDALSTTDVYAEPNQLLRQQRPGRFVDISTTLPAVSTVGCSRAAAFGDYDNDGDVDILVVHRDHGAQLLRNDSTRLGGFVTVRLVEPCGRDALGARLSGRIGNARRMMDSRGYSYCATNDPRIHLGLGSATTIRDVQVRWADGSVEAFEPLEANSMTPVIRGSGRAVAP